MLEPQQTEFRLRAEARGEAVRIWSSDAHSQAPELTVSYRERVPGDDQPGRPTPTVPPPSDEGVDPRSFAASSPFNTPIGPDVRIDPRSRAMVAILAGRGYATAQIYADTPPVYEATPATPRRRISCTRPWGTCDLERRPVPVPQGAMPSHGYDASMVVIDRAAEKVYEFWRYDPGAGTAGWGAVLPLHGNGTGKRRTSPGQHGATGAGISRLAGVIRTHEVRQGRIEHALAGPTGFSCKNSYRYPAVKTDGWSTHAGCIPEGARVQLDPSVDCAGLPDAQPWEVMVCRALQEYGWYNIDNGNAGVKGFGIQFENPAGENNDPYRARGIEEYKSIRHIPLDRLRVLQEWNSFG